MTHEQQAAARKMLSDSETARVLSLAGELEQLIQGRLAAAGLGLSGAVIGMIAAEVRLELRNEIDEAIYKQRCIDPARFTQTPHI